MFDGHHGKAAAENCAENMHNMISQTINDFRQENPHVENLITDNNNVEENSFFGNWEEEDTHTATEFFTDSQISKCMSKSYFEMDEYLSHGINERSK